jgi:hypothetical protein
MTIFGSRPLAFALASLTSASLIVSLAPAANATGSTAATAPTARPMTVGIMDVAKGAYAVYGKYKTCLANIEVGQPCTASDSSNIRAILSRLQAFEEKVQANHTETIARFDVLENSLNSQTLDGYVNALRPLEVNGENAMRAYLAISECLVAATSPDATCQAFIGGTDLEDPQPVKDALAETELYFTEQVGFMSKNIDLTIAEFTGTAQRKGENGLAHAAWKLSKRMQDQDLEVTKKSVMDSNTTSVVTKELADEVNFYLDSYESIFDRYGFLLVTAAGIAGGANGDARAKSMQRTVDTKILSDADRYTLRGASKHYRMPVMQDSEITVVLAGKPTIVGNKRGLGRNLTNADITNMAATLNGYSTTNKVSAAVPDAFPAERLYTVTQNVRPFKHEAHTCIFYTGCVWTQMIISHSLAGTDSPTLCPVRMRPMNSKPSWDTSFEKWLYAEPSMGRNFFYKTYEAQVKGAVDYEWATGTLVGDRGRYPYGWGALVTCLGNDQLDTAHDLNPMWYPMIKG